MNFKPFPIMPKRLSKRKVHQGSFQDLDDSAGTSSRRPSTRRSGLTQEQMSEITQQIDFKKLKDENRKPENTILRALGSLSENSPNNDANNMSISTALREEESGQDCLESFRLDSQQENLIPESVFADPSSEVDDNEYILWHYNVAWHRPKVFRGGEKNFNQRVKVKERHEKMFYGCTDLRYF